MSCCIKFLVPFRFSLCMTVDFKLLFRVSGKMYYNLMVLRQSLMVLLLHNLYEKILYLDCSGLGFQ